MQANGFMVYHPDDKTRTLGRFFGVSGVYWFYIMTMGKKMETTIVLLGIYWGYIGIIGVLLWVGYGLENSALGCSSSGLKLKSSPKGPCTQ